MRKMLLTSAGTEVMEEILKVLPKPADQIKLAYIITAAKVEPDISYLKQDQENLEKIGITVVVVDIEGLSKDEVTGVLLGKDVIYVQGGNTFFLLKCLKESGADQVIKKLVDSGVLYIGVSAGSYVVCPTIESATWKPYPDRDDFDLADYTAMNMVPFIITAHYKPEYAEYIKKGMVASSYPTKILTDEQALLIEGNEARLCGEGSEIRLI